MKINLCFKGIRETPSFTDSDAQAVLTHTGIESAWLRTNYSSQAKSANIASQSALNQAALDDHVNNYAAVARTTPYISLTTGCYEYQGRNAPPLPHTGLSIALGFATGFGSSSGYVFRCWTVTSLQRTPELPYISEEVGDLDLFAHFYRYHYEGEIAAKVAVPRRQIAWVCKFDSSGQPEPTWGASAVYVNPDFTHPARASNVVASL